MPFQPVAIRIAHSADQDRIRAPGNVQRRLRQRVAARLIGSAADLGRLEHKIPRAGRSKHPYGLCDYFWTDPVARQKRAQHTGFPLRLSRSEEHTSALQSLMRISYAVFCLTQTN